MTSNLCTSNPALLFSEAVVQFSFTSRPFTFDVKKVKLTGNGAFPSPNVKVEKESKPVTDTVLSVVFGVDEN